MRPCRPLAVAGTDIKEYCGFVGGFSLENIRGSHIYLNFRLDAGPTVLMRGSGKLSPQSLTMSLFGLSITNPKP